MNKYVAEREGVRACCPCELGSESAKAMFAVPVQTCVFTGTASSDAIHENMLSE